jgi:hypothetical protein
MMGMASPQRQLYVVYSVNGKDIDRMPLNTFDMGPTQKRLAMVLGNRDVIDVRWEYVDPPDFRSRAERRGQKPKRQHGPNKNWWNRR